jgi:hypothetical protein
LTSFANINVPFIGDILTDFSSLQSAILKDHQNALKNDVNMQGNLLMPGYILD